MSEIGHKRVMKFENLQGYQFLENREKTRNLGGPGEVRKKSGTSKNNLKNQVIFELGEK